jgi:GT2 family glycosyltransferase
LILGPIDWKFRFQRPQQLATEFAKNGVTTIYLNPTINGSLEGHTRTKSEIINGVEVVTIALDGSKQYVGVKKLTDDRAMAAALLIEDLLFERKISPATIITMQPGWANIVERLGNNEIIFDCIDFHQGFELIEESVISSEKALCGIADHITTTSSQLSNFIQDLGYLSSAIVRNAVSDISFETFAESIEGELNIGYFGAISSWFDVNLVKHLSNRFPLSSIHLIGNIDDPVVHQDLSALRNVKVYGEIQFRKLSALVKHWNVGIIPFKVNELTRSTNPVKMYEYAASGIPTVATLMPEVVAASNEVRGIFACDSYEDFEQAIREARDFTKAERQTLRNWALENTWPSRVLQFNQLIGLAPKVSIVVLMWNNASLTITCLKSIITRTDYGNYEVICIDNGSNLNQSLLVRSWCEIYGDGRIMFKRSDNNLGFPAGMNFGMKTCNGEIVILLNNDTEVTPGWLHRGVRYFRNDPDLGLMTPSTDNCGNEAMVTLRGDKENWLEESLYRFGMQPPELLEVSNLGFFCVYIRRDVIDSIGYLDEAFGMGYFEDDDYCMRARSAGYKLGIARDIFVHHEMSQSFDKISSEQKEVQFQKNKSIYESKWGEWTPHVSASDRNAF